MAELKTKKNDQSVDVFMSAIEDETKRQDCKKIALMMEEVTQSPPVMWGDSIVGFGSYTYTYASGRSNAWFLCGFSPRKQNITLYIMSGFSKFPDQLSRLGKHSTGKGCLYIKKLGDIDQAVLREMVSESVAQMRTMNT